MSKLLITAIKTTTPDKKVSTDPQVVIVESDKITVVPSGAGSLILANGFQYEVEATVSEVAQALAATDLSDYET